MTAEIKPGTVVQIAPTDENGWAECLVVVTEIKSWGVMGYALIPGLGGGKAYYRIKTGEYAVLGTARWWQE